MTGPYRSSSPFYVRILGCGSAKPSLRHHPSAQAVVLGSRVMLVDCGEGTQLQMERLGVRQSKVTDIFISHLHADHFLGLPGLLNTMIMNGRREPVRIHTTAEGAKLLRAVMDVISPGTEIADFRVFDPEKPGVIVDDDSLTVETVKLHHRVPCCGFVFREKGTQEGAKRSYAYCSDTAFSEDVAKAVGPVSVLYHEATYGAEDADKAAARGHSTAAEAGRAAQLARAGGLVIGHYSMKIADEEALAREAEAAFGGPTVAAREGITIDIL